MIFEVLDLAYLTQHLSLPMQFATNGRMLFLNGWISFYNIYFNFSVYVCECMCVSTEASKGRHTHAIEVTGQCEGPHVGVRNETGPGSTAGVVNC